MTDVEFLHEASDALSHLADVYQRAADVSVPGVFALGIGFAAQVLTALAWGLAEAADTGSAAFLDELTDLTTGRLLAKLIAARKTEAGVWVFEPAVTQPQTPAPSGE